MLISAAVLLWKQEKASKTQTSPYVPTKQLGSRCRVKSAGAASRIYHGAHTVAGRAGQDLCG